MAYGSLLDLGLGIYGGYKAFQKKGRLPVLKTPQTPPITPDNTVVPQPPVDNIMQPPRPTSTTSTYKAPTQPLTNPFQGMGTIGSYGTDLTPQGLEQARNRRMAGLNTSYDTQVKDIFQQYKDTMGETKFKDLQARGEFTNAQGVTESIDKVQKNITEGVINPQDIAKNTGLSIDQVNRIMGGRAFQDLQFSSTPGVARERATQDYQNRLQDLTKDQTRTEEDIQIKSQRLTDQLKTDTEDINRKLGLTMGATEKMGALQGTNLSSLHQAGLMNIQNDAQRTIGELTKQWTNQTDDITRIKNRVLEDYTQNATRLKQTLDRGFDDMKIQTLSLIQDYHNMYGISDKSLTKAVTDLQLAVLKEQDYIIGKYQDGMIKYSDTQKDYYKMLKEFNDEQGKMTSIPGTSLFWNPTTGKVYDPQSMYAQQQAIASITTQEIGGRPVTLQASALQGLSSVDQALQSAGLGNIRLGADETSSTRDQARTIEKMAKRYGITYNANNPNETAQALRSAGHQVADVGKSLHEKGLAVDIYPDHAYIKKVKPYMEAQGWKQTNPANDAGHFEFLGGGQQQEPTAAEMKIFNSSSPIGKNKLTQQRYNDIASYMKDKGYSTDKTAITEVTGLRKEFEGLPRIENYNSVNNNYQNLLSNIDANTAPGDVAAIFAFMKMLDPNSVVREGEFATAQNTAGVPDRIVNAYNNAMKGTRLGSPQRKEYKISAEGIIKSNIKIYNDTLERYQSYVTQGGDPNLIGKLIGDQGTTQTPPQGGDTGR